MEIKTLEHIHKLLIEEHARSREEYYSSRKAHFALLKSISSCMDKEKLVELKSQSEAAKQVYLAAQTKYYDCCAILTDFENHEW